MCVCVCSEKKDEANGLLDGKDYQDNYSLEEKKVIAPLLIAAYLGRYQLKEQKIGTCNESYLTHIQY